MACLLMPLYCMHHPPPPGGSANGIVFCRLVSKQLTALCKQKHEHYRGPPDRLYFFRVGTYVNNTIKLDG